ncbi:MAG TPA: hypothetical protein VMR62_33245 [Bryobacteraceae bacterium]|jgi:hypothetical protein|nr:hypothetical protein [Bryobacteraceae bacterium]
MSAAISNLQEQDAVTPHVLWDRFECAILESPSKTCLVSRAEAQGLRLEGFRSGLLFGKDAELRFRQRRGGKYHLVYIDDIGGHLNGAEPKNLQDDTGPERIFLWGEAFGEGFWYEARIPGKLAYPVAAGWRVAVRTKHYLLEAKDPLRPDSPASRVHLFRCFALEPVAELRPGKE